MTNKEQCVPHFSLSSRMALLLYNAQQSANGSRRCFPQQSDGTLLLVELGRHEWSQRCVHCRFVVNGSVERLLMAVVHAYVLQSRRLELCGLGLLAC